MSKLRRKGHREHAKTTAHSITHGYDVHIFEKRISVRFQTLRVGFECDQCGLVLQSRDGLRKHRLGHEVGGLKYCTLCETSVHKYTSHDSGKKHVARLRVQEQIRESQALLMDVDVLLNELAKLKRKRRATHL